MISGPQGYALRKCDYFSWLETGYFGSISHWSFPSPSLEGRGGSTGAITQLFRSSYINRLTSISEWRLPLGSHFEEFSDGFFNAFCNFRDALTHHIGRGGNNMILLV